MKNKAIFFYLMLLLASHAVAQTGVFHQAEGVLLDKNSGKPVELALVSAPDAGRNTISAADGKFVLRNLPGSSQRITVVSMGYKPWSAIVAFDTLKTLTIYLERGNRELEEIVIYGTQSQTEDQTVGHVTAIAQRGMRSRGALSISDGIAQLPGITQLSTGAGISKPVIRGLYGNRIQTVMMGMRFDNQQWQDEHGLGLSDIGIDRVEVIKGPAALMYGSEAMGGVVSIIEEKPALSDSLQGDASARLYSNTYGATTDAGIKQSFKNKSWRIRIGADSHADYSDGNNKRVQNSRFDSYIAKGTYAFNRERWSCVNNYIASKSDFGFIMDTANAIVADGRLSRDFSEPHHTVYINMLTSQNTFYGHHNNTWNVNLGGHLNRRLENEGGGGVSLDMRLITAASHVQYHHPFNERWTIHGGWQSQFQTNTNLGWRIIVPDALLGESSVYAYLKENGKRIIFESGLRYDMRYIRTEATTPNGLFVPPAVLNTVDKLYQSVNGSAGISVKLIGDLHFKTNFTSGYRTPNLAELESNGVHEGTLRYEIGNPDMKTEQNFCAEAGFHFDSEHFSFVLSAYRNQFANYIYLTPTSSDWYGFRIYRFIQTDAVLQGGEASVDWNPGMLPWLDVTAAYSQVNARTAEGNYLPFIPASRLNGSIKIESPENEGKSDPYFRAGAQYYFPQNHPAQFETSTSDYLLVDAGAGAKFKLHKNRSLSADLAVTNLLNKVYYDHLSRFKEFAIYNMGRNIVLSLNYNW